MRVGFRHPSKVGAGVPSRRLAIALAIFVTFLWSTSWILIKVGLQSEELEPLSFAGVRYGLAAAILLPLGLPALRRARPWAAGRGLVLRAAVLGLLLYAVAQGAQFAALDVLPAATVSLVLSGTPVAVALLSRRHATEAATRIQALGIAVLVAGVLLYFGLAAVPAGALLGVAIAVVGMLATAVGAQMGRMLARDAMDSFGGVVALTGVTMAIGAAVLLGAGVALEGVPRLSATGWLICGWLALVNTAFAFTIWNHTMRQLTAIESSVLNTAMVVQIA
ncbi:MAG: DMT family transporter, partial [Chloroflexota bacterium]|nr:DMT family transporter [Chloroflexota bacterium]